MPEIWGTTRVLAVIGDPVRHSFSPPMQNAALAALGLDGVYVPFEVPPAGLKAALEGFRAAGVVGFNATLPHKEALLELVDEATDEARLTGTVNTVHFVAGRAIGDSTDGPGFVAGLAAAGVEPAGERVLLLGAGGSARAIGVALVRAGVAKLLLANRTESRARELAARLNALRAGVAEVLAPPTAPALVAEVAVVVNTTSVGMHPRADAMPLELERLVAGQAVVDIIYNPLETRLLRRARELGARTINGCEMLVHQGALALARWTGCEPPVAVMREALLRELANRAAGDVDRGNGWRRGVSEGS